MIRFVRVKDLTTRHEFDVPENDPRIAAGYFRVLPRYEAVASPRRPKPYRDMRKLRRANNG